MNLLFHRPSYLKRLLPKEGEGRLKILYGIRGAGKSSLPELVKDHLIEKEEAVETQYLSLNLEAPSSEPLLNVGRLREHLQVEMKKRKLKHVFLKEIQNVPNFEFAGSEVASQGLNVFLTGSDARVLSPKWHELLPGQVEEIPVFPLSLSEHMKAVGGQNAEAAFKSFLDSSSFPCVLQAKGCPEFEEEYLEGLLNTILVKNVLQRGCVSNAGLLKSILKFCWGSDRRPLSVSKVKEEVEKAGFKADNKTVEKHLKLLEEAFLLYPAPVLDIRKGKILKSFRKFFWPDIGLAAHLLGSGARKDKDALMENLVFLELRSRNYQVFAGRWDGVETGFVAKRKGETLYIKIEAFIPGHQDLQNTLLPLQSIKGADPKILLTSGQDDIDFAGIKIMKLARWLATS